MHAGQRFGGGDVDGEQPAMRHRTAQEGRMQHSGQGDVRDIASLAAQECIIFQPAD